MTPAQACGTPWAWATEYALMSKPDFSEVKFEGEEPGSDYASPILDMIAAAILVAISVVTMVASVRLPMPGAIHTAPGLLPFIVAASLMVMALGLGASAFARHRAGLRMSLLSGRDLGTDARSLVLAVAVAIYIAALQSLAFQQNFQLFGANLRLTAFEPCTIIALAAIMHMSWRGPIWITATVSVVWTVVLSLVFQIVFRIPLPGSF